MLKNPWLNRFIFISLLIVQTYGIADDGMWMPHQMKMLNLEKEGLQMDPDDLYKPDGTGLMSAVVDLGRGTASFVSNKGLLFTNHHVAFTALQRVSDPEHNYLQNGFLAKTAAEEIQAPGYTAGVLISYKEVSDQIFAGLKNDLSPLERFKAIDLAKKKLVQQAEAGGQDLFAEVASMYAGNQYYLFVYKHIKDIRIVYAPPRDLGNFGGEVDNWMWPRHTCDFTFLRAYVSPEGLGVEYSPENVPYEPKVYLHIADTGLKDGGFTFIMGYPGKTYRNYSTPELIFDIEKLEKSIEARLEYISFFEEASQKSEAVKIKYAGTLKGLYNGLKNYRGKLQGFAKADLVNKKKEIDRQFYQWVQRDESLIQQYGGIVERINQFLTSEYKDFYWTENELTKLTYYRRGAALPRQAHVIVRIVLERRKPDLERDERYQERSLPKLISNIKLAERSYDLEVDKEYTILRLKELADLPQERVPQFLQSIINQPGGITSWTTSAFRNTKIITPEYRLPLIEKTPDELKALKDPLIDFAFELEKELSDLREKKHVMDQKLEDLKKIYIKGMLEMHNNHMAPDANSTIRFTSGPVKGYTPRDAVYYEPFTTLKGLIEKDIGEYPFHVPEKLKTLHKEKNFGNYAAPELGDVPACFLNTTNVTGGNSGSPAINAKGEIAGIVFDMVYESVIGDYYIIPQLQRVINADIRYVLFVTEKFSGATHLIKEMGLRSR
jgi:hypothetical protein